MKSRPGSACAGVLLRYRVSPSAVPKPCLRTVTRSRFLACDLRYPQCVGIGGRLASRRIAQLGVALACSATLLAQQAEVRPEQRFGVLPQYRERVEVRLGTVDVAVANKDGGTIADLGRGDFAVFVDGQEREITHFARYGPAKPVAPVQAPAATPESQAVPAPSPAAEPLSRQPLMLVILIDNENTSVFNRNHLLKRVNEYVRAHLVPPDTAAVFTNEKYLRLVCPPTSNPERVVVAVEGLLGKSSGSNATQGLVRMGEDQIRQIWEDRGANLQDQMMMVVRTTSGQIRTSLKLTVNTIKTLIRSLSGMPGRKAVLYVSDGLPMNPGVELYQLVAEYFPRGAVRDVTAATDDATSLYQEVADFALAANVTFYTIDARGLIVPGGFEADRRASYSSRFSIINMHNYQQTLSYLATRTGGRAILNTNDFTAGLETIAAQLESYYSLGFRLDPAEGDVQHRIEVRVHREGKYQIRYRPGFVQRTLATRVADRTAAALLFDLPDNPLEVSVQTGAPRAAGEKRWIVPVSIGVPLAKLALLPDQGGSVATLTVFYQAASGEGRRSAMAQNRHVVKLSASQLERVKTVTISTEVEIGPGEHRISVGVLDEGGGQAGYAVAPVTSTAK